MAAGDWKGQLTTFATGQGQPDPFFPGDRSVNGNGWFGGGQIGYNWEGGIFSPRAVWGFEADIDWAAFNGSNSFFSVAMPPIFPRPGQFVHAFDFKMDYFGTVRARLGYDLGLFLPYVTGGLAYGHMNLKETAFIPPISSAPSGIGYADETRVGWTAGAGLEYAIAPHWSVKAEWLYVDLGTRDTRFVGTLFPPFGTGVFDTDGFHSRLTFNTFKGGVNFRW